MKRSIVRWMILAVYVFVNTSFLHGCWDYKEIEKRGYVLGIAIDKADYVKNNSNSMEYMPLEAKGPLYSYTIQIPVISSSLNKPTGQSGANADKARHWNLTIVSNSFFEANREYSTRTDYAPYYPHLKSIIISEEVARDDISGILDMFLRDPEMRRRTKIFITPGNARKALDVIPKIDDYSSIYLSLLPTNSSKTSRMLHKTDLGKVSEAIHDNKDFALPKIIIDKHEIKDAGCAVFKDNKMVGWLDEIKTSYLKWIVNYANGGLVSINLPEYKDHPIVLEIKKVNTKQRPVVKNGSVKMRIDVKANLSIGEINSPEAHSVMDTNFLKRLEKAAEEQIKHQIEGTISYVQKEYDADIFFFGTNIKRFVPGTWEKIKDDWHEEFKDIKVEVNVKVKINQIGLIK